MMICMKSQGFGGSKRGPLNRGAKITLSLLGEEP